MEDAIQLEFDFSKDDKITISKTIEQSDIDNESYYGHSLIITLFIMGPIMGPIIPIWII